MNDVFDKIIPDGGRLSEEQLQRFQVYATDQPTVLPKMRTLYFHPWHVRATRRILRPFKALGRWLLCRRGVHLWKRISFIDFDFRGFQQGMPSTMSLCNGKQCVFCEVTNPPHVSPMYILEKKKAKETWQHMRKAGGFSIGGTGNKETP